MSSVEQSEDRDDEKESSGVPCGFATWEYMVHTHKSCVLHLWCSFNLASDVCLCGIKLNIYLNLLHLLRADGGVAENMQ